MTTILVTGAAGYIASHVCVELLESGHDVVGIDNFSNSSRKSITRVEELAKRKMNFRELDLRDNDALNDLFSSYDVDAVMHFAGLKSVGESMAAPILYYDNNIAATINLVQAMVAAGVRRMVFSSSCTVYGDPKGPKSHSMRTPHDSPPILTGAPNTYSRRC